LTDLLSSSGRRAINLLTHDQLFSAKTAPRTPRPTLPAVTGGSGTEVQVVSGFAAEDDDDPLAIIIRKACSRELTDLGLGFNSLNIKVVQSEVAEARRRQSAAEAQANADIVAAQQSRRAKEAQLEAERAISDRELEQTKASNAALIAQAEAKRQESMAVQREAELDATLIAQAKAEAEKVKIDAQAGAEAEAIRIRTVAEATAESIRQVNAAIRE